MGPIWSFFGGALSFLWNWGLLAVGWFTFVVIIWFLPLWVPYVVNSTRPAWLWYRQDGSERFARGWKRTLFYLFLAGIGVLGWALAAVVMSLFGENRMSALGRMFGLIVVGVPIIGRLLLIGLPEEPTDRNRIQRAVVYITENF